ncbi:beta-N-acetylhexosaminidase [Vibrio sp.]|nr:beta-N-acetylhexosaminidase [Vibrio sp.]
MNLELSLRVTSDANNLCQFQLTLRNTSEKQIKNWQLNFIFERFIDPSSISAGKIEQIGSFCQYLPEESITLDKHSTFDIEFSFASQPFKLYSEGIKDACVIIDGVNFPVKVNTLQLPHEEIPFSLLTPPQTPSDHPLIPQPSNIKLKDGQRMLTPSSAVVLHPDAMLAYDWFHAEIKQTYDLSLHHAQCDEAADIIFEHNKQLNDEAYQLSITATQITVIANNPKGFLNACASLFQLINSSNDGYLLPLCHIEDQPHYRYRGMMFDCVRHFYTVDEVKRVINFLALYKFNVFHWHLTDDEGWRIEIKALPELTKYGAFRGPNETLEPQFSHINERHGGFYTQKEIKEVIEYAQERGIDVIPEIDIPGHCRAAIKALPMLLIEQDDKSEYRSVQAYNDNVLNPGLEGTYHFLDAVIEEVAALFPATWFHIGADEVPKGVWEKSPLCHILMKEHYYYDPMELQGHLLRYVEKKLTSLGKRMVGWEEAQYGDKVSTNTVIYSWQNEEAALLCAHKGYDVILQPAQNTYFDIVQSNATSEYGSGWAGVVSLEDTYSYFPLKDIESDSPLRDKVVGLQCAIWTEHIQDQARLDHMLFPRLLAMSETCWTDTNQKSWPDFVNRLCTHLPLLEKKGALYRKPW